MPLPLQNSYAQLPDRLYEHAHPTPVARPSLVLLNEDLAKELGLSPSELRADSGLAYLAGNEAWPGSEPLALAYAGHQFGGFVPQLGDGRAHLLGEIMTPEGHRYDLQLKGSGPTKYSRGGDGRAALGPVLREYIMSEAMHALGVPTTRSLAAVGTGEAVHRETVLPGAILSRVAASHLRIGTFEYLAARRDIEALTLLVDYALERHFPDTTDGRPAGLRLLDSVISVQAKLIAHWMNLGFVHGVMNTDNCTISGQTIDYGPCAFLDSYDPGRTFSSIDRGGRYAFHQQPAVAQWNLARLAEALLPLIHPEEDKAVGLVTTLLHEFPDRFDKHYAAHSQRRLGLSSSELAASLHRELLGLMKAARSDFTLTFRSLLDFVRAGRSDSVLTHLKAEPATTDWLQRYKEAHLADPEPHASRCRRMETENPLFIPRNHRVEEALEAAQEGDLSPFSRLLQVVKSPFDAGVLQEDPTLLALAEPPGQEQWSYVTFCGT